MASRRCWTPAWLATAVATSRVVPVVSRSDQVRPGARHSQTTSTGCTQERVFLYIPPGPANSFVGAPCTRAVPACQHERGGLRQHGPDGPSTGPSRAPGLDWAMNDEGGRLHPVRHGPGGVIPWAIRIHGLRAHTVPTSQHKRDRPKGVETQSHQAWNRMNPRLSDRTGLGSSGTLWVQIPPSPPL